MWAIIKSEFSNNASCGITSPFRCMFPNSTIAQSFQVGSDKLRYLHNFGIAPYFKSLLYENLNDKTQTFQMDLVRYFDNVDNLVNVRFYDSQFIGHSTHKDRQNHFSESLENLDGEKLQRGWSKRELEIS